MTHYAVLGKEYEEGDEILLGIVEKANAETALHSVTGGEYNHYRVIPVGKDAYGDPLMYEFDAEEEWDRGFRDV